MINEITNNKNCLEEFPTKNFSAEFLMTLLAKEKENSSFSGFSSSEEHPVGSIHLNNCGRNLYYQYKIKTFNHFFGTVVGEGLAAKFEKI